MPCPRVYKDQTNYMFSSAEPRDPKERKLWRNKRFIIFGLFVLFLASCAFSWERWVSGNALLGRITWPGIYETYGDKFMTKRCPNNCSGNAALEGCDPQVDTYCKCKAGFIGYDCSLELCVDCRIPDALVIGVQKGGTSALAYYLQKNPRFLAPRSRKDHFFDDRWYEGFLWYFGLWDPNKEIYKPHLELESAGSDEDNEENYDINDNIDVIEDNDEKEPDNYGEDDKEEEEIEEEVYDNKVSGQSVSTTKRRKIKYGGSPQYIVNDVAMRRLYAFHPWIKMIVLLREPTSRSYSAGLMNSFKGSYGIEKEKRNNEQIVNTYIDTLVRNVVHNTEQCFAEARSRRNTPFFRELISQEVEELSQLRGTDIDAVYEYYACLSVTPSALITPMYVAETFPSTENSGIRQYFTPQEMKPVIVRIPNSNIIIKSMYYHQFSVWFTFFSVDQFKIIDSNDLRANTGKVIGDIEYWLGSIEEGDEIYQYPESDLTPKNTAANPFIIPDKTRRFLNDFYEPYNEKLKKLLKRDFGWNY